MIVMKIVLNIIILLLSSMAFGATSSGRESLFYDKKWDARDGLCRVLKWVNYNGHIMPLYGFVNRSDSVIIPIEFDYAEDMCKGYALVANRREDSTPLPPYSIIWRVPCYEYDYISKDNKRLWCDFDYATSISSIDSTAVVGFTQIQHHFELASRFWTKKHRIKLKELKRRGFMIRYDYKEIASENEADLHQKAPIPFDNMLCDRVQNGEVDSMNYEGFTIKRGKIIDVEKRKEVFITTKYEDAKFVISKFLNDRVIVYHHGYVGLYSYGNNRPNYEKEFFPCTYDAIIDCDNNIFIVSKNGKWGVIDIEGNVIQPCIYNRIWESQQKGLYKVASFTGDYTHDFYDGMVPLFAYGCMDSKGEIIIPVKHKGDMGWHAGIRVEHPNLIFAKDSLWSVYNMSGTLLHDNKFTYLSYHQYGKYTVPELNKKKGLMDEFGNLLFAPTYDDIRLWCDDSDFFAVEKKDRFGVVDRNNNIMVDFVYDEFGFGSNKCNLKPFKRDGKWGYMGMHTFMEIITPQYDYAQSFNNGVAVVRIGDKEGVIDENGRVIVPIKYSTANISESGLSAKDGDGVWHYFDSTGKEVEKGLKQSN